MLIETQLPLFELRNYSDKDVLIKKNAEAPRLESIEIIAKRKPFHRKKLSIHMIIPFQNICGRWTADSVFRKGLMLSEKLSCNIGHEIPIICYYDSSCCNCFTLAVSECVCQVNLCQTITQPYISLEIELERVPDPQKDEPASLFLRLDCRPVFYSQILRDVSDWYKSFHRSPLPPINPSAEVPLYSTWYSYGKNITAAEVEKECSYAKTFGIDGVIVDDGWQTDSNDSFFAYCGNWEPSSVKFSHMHSHVQKIHSLGMKYLLWYALPFIGAKSSGYAFWKDKFLYKNKALQVGVLDPRYPEVRHFLTQTLIDAVTTWDLDGFKLDFINDFFRLGQNHYSARSGNMDVSSTAEAVQKLLGEIYGSLKAVKPEILIEFRQCYIAPAVRPFCSMFRAADCPHDFLSNRIRVIDLKLGNPDTPIHSDMIYFPQEESPEVAALQIWNVIFSVPQISIKLEQLQEGLRKMLSFVLHFWNTQKATLLHGKLYPYHPELNYPVVMAEDDKATIIAAYLSGQVLDLGIPRIGTHCFIINATADDYIFLQLSRLPVHGNHFNVFGEKTVFSDFQKGINKITVYRSGILEIVF